MLRHITKTIRSTLRQQSFIHTVPVADECPIKINENDGVREIILNQPNTRNTLSYATMELIINGISENIHDASLRCIVLSSTGPVFSAGHNLRELTADKGAERQRGLFNKCAEMISKIHQAPVPIIAKVDGLAAGAGLQLVASCDILVCSEKSSFSCPPANYGLFCHTPAVALTRVMARMKSSYIVFTGMTINAQEAYISGLVSVVVPGDKLDDEVAKICNSIKSKSRPVIKMGKEFYYKQLELNIREAYEQASGTMVKNLGLNDGKEGVQSFVEKRKPKWSHS